MCPALNDQICAMCCGTKRMVEIRCPSDCPYLATAREHPPAVVVRQQRQDLGLLVEFLRDLNARQSQLFFLIAALIARYKPSELESIVDDDVVQAAGTLAATYETAARGVIYEHRAASIPAARLATALKAALTEAAGDRILQARIHVSLARTCGFDLRYCARHARAGLALAEREGDQGLIGTTFAEVGGVLCGKVFAEGFFSRCTI